MPIVATDLLDPRPDPVAHSAPIPNAVNIPAADLRTRVFELPPPNVSVRVIAFEPHATTALDVLRELGRVAEPVSCSVPSAKPRAAQRRRLWRPSAAIETIAPRLQVGRALDLGCGAGRDAVFLADLGWSVTAVDRLPDALERAEQLRARYTPHAKVRWLQSNLRSGDWPLPPHGFELVCAVRFYSAALLPRMAEYVAPNGHLVIEAFHPHYATTTGRRVDSHACLAPDEAALARDLPGFTLRALEVDNNETPRLTRMWAGRGVL